MVNGGGRAKIQRGCEVWLEGGGMSFQQLAERVSADQVLDHMVLPTR